MVVVGCTDLRQRRFQVNLLLRRCRHTYLWRKSQMYARTEAWLMMLMSMVQTPASLQGFIPKVDISCFAEFVFIPLCELISVFILSVSNLKLTGLRSQTTMSHCCNSISTMWHLPRAFEHKKNLKNCMYRSITKKSSKYYNKAHFIVSVYSM